MGVTERKAPPTPTKRCVALAGLLPGNNPPTEFLIWAFGRVKTTKGNFLFDDEGARSVMSAYVAYANRLTIDYEHKAVDPNRRAGDGKAAGSFELELRADGLYAVDVRWTPPATEALTNKEWLYFSPYFSAEEESGRILELINLALTNIPATMGLTPLVAAQRSASMSEQVHDTTATEVATSDETDPDDEAKQAARKSAKGRLAKARAELAAAEAECTAFGEDDDDQGEDVSDEKSNRASAAPPATTAQPASTGVVASRIAAAARSLTGMSDEGEIIGALTALSNATRTNVSLSKRLADLERRLRRSDVESMVTRAVKAGKLTPAEREWALSYGMESPAKLRGYLDVTPARANVAGAGTEHREPPLRPGDARGPSLAVALSDEERRICANTGIDPEKFAAVKHRPVRVG